MAADGRLSVRTWPSQSPDLNPIENFWAAVEKKVRKRKYRSADELFQGLQAAWESVPEDFCRTMVDSMNRRCQAVIKAKGFATKY